jgi:hypothetical protein
MLLSEDDVVALVRYLFEPQTALLGADPEQPGPIEDPQFAAFLRPGMVAMTRDDNAIVNGEAHWSLKSFKRNLAHSKTHVTTAKVHTLPWKGGARIKAVAARLRKRRRSR